MKDKEQTDIIKFNLNVLYHILTLLPLLIVAILFNDYCLISNHYPMYLFIAVLNV